MGQRVLNDVGTFTDQEYRQLYYEFNRSQLSFTRFFLKNREGIRFILSEHHKIIARTLEDVFEGRTKRLIINVPPGYTKTELAVIHFMSRGLALNPRARFIHLSASDDLALRNSSETRDTITNEHFQTLYPEVKLRHDTTAKKQWRTTKGGGVYALAARGTVIGFRAGRMDEGFQGALVIDDPIKPEDVYSDAIRKRTNERFNHTSRTRLARPDTPIIVIMQRLHDDDLSGFLLRGGSGDVWEHLVIPVEITDVDPPYPSGYTHGIQINHGLPLGPTWPFKHDLDDIKILKADEFVYSAQFAQEPSTYGGGMFHDEHWKYYDRYSPAESCVYLIDGTKVNLEYKHIYSDTAFKTGQEHDYSVFQLWAMGDDGRIYLLDQVRGKWEAFELERKFIKFCERHDYQEGVVPMGVRRRRVEDKASGTGLIQNIKNKKGWNYVEGIPRDRDKVSRAASCLSPLAEGRVVIPRSNHWVDDYRYEFRMFSRVMSHKHDDQIDPTLDAIHEMVIERKSGNELYKKITGGK